MNLTRMGGLGVAVAAGLATIAAGLTPATARVAAPGSSVAPRVTYFHGTPGFARLIPRHAPHGAANATVRAIPRGARHLPAGHFSARESIPRAPAAASGAAAAASAPMQAFNGTSSLDSQVTNYNLKFEPPDQGICRGNNYVLEPVNSAYRIYFTGGKTARGPFNINDLFNVGGKEFTSDPRCWFDRSTGTWFAVVLFLNDTGTQGTELIAVRHNPNPLGLWNEYSIDATDLGGRGCPCFGDQPRIGFDQYNMYITADEFSIQKPPFNGAEMWVIDKAQLVAGDPSPRFVHFGHLKFAGHLGLAPQPASTTGTPRAEYMLSSMDFGGRGASSIGVWAVTKRASVGAGGTPVLSAISLNTEAYANPPSPPQKGNSSKLNSGDDRMQNTSFAGGTVWGEMTTAVTPAGDSAVRSGGAWFQVAPKLGTNGITGASVVRQGYIDTPGKYLIYPSVQPDAAGNAAAIFTETNSAMFPSVAFATLKAGASDFGTPAVALAGAGPYDPNAGRWGDYSYAVPDDRIDAAWLATEYMPPKSSQTTNGARNWGTGVIEVKLG